MKKLLNILPLLIVALILLPFFAILLWNIEIVHIDSYDVRGRAKKLKQDMPVLVAAIRAYMADHHELPVWGVGDQGASGFAPLNSDAYKMPTFRVWAAATSDSIKGSDSQFHILTTPVAYLSHFPSDPFNKTRNATYSYYTTGTKFIVLSPGPDMEYDILPFNDFTAAADSTSLVFIGKKYDPTNGVISAGDLFFIGY